MDPNQAPQNNPNPPLFNAPYQSPQAPEPTFTPPTVGGGSSKSKFLMAFAVISAIELLVIIGLAVAVISSSNDKEAPTQANAKQASQSEGPTAATSSSIQLIDDAISQSLSGLNDDQDFPADKLSDKNLGL